MNIFKGKCQLYVKNLILEICQNIYWLQLLNFSTSHIPVIKLTMKYHLLKSNDLLYIFLNRKLKWLTWILSITVHIFYSADNDTKAQIIISECIFLLLFIYLDNTSHRLKHNELSVIRVIPQLKCFMDVAKAWS